ncbi:MAG: threonine synthase [Endomicrobia bacterium]|nr:threonine synthase [Endomicrobiia bacterium]MDW8056416.1 threonine synthase [Elusimicrobiota bacterium]
MSYIKGLKCKECNREYKKEPIYVCEYCFGPLEVVYDYEKIKKVLSKEVILSRGKNLWRYKELLPIDGEPVCGLNSGFTPLYEAKNLAKFLGVKELYIKDDSCNHPTLSFKDRVVAVALSKAKEFGFDTVACASTGNLANAVAAHSRYANFECYVFIPYDLEASKVISSAIYGVNVVAIEGSYDDVNRLCAEIASKYKWAFVNVNLRPYYSEGSKTYGFEIVEQLGWQAPKHIVVPAASGSLLTKIYKGIKEFCELGLIKSFDTKFYVAQADGCSPIATAFKENTDIIKPVKPNTIAKSIAIGNPADGVYALDVVKKTGGFAEVATDKEIIEAIKLLADKEGIFTETAGGVTLAVAKKLIEKKIIPKDETIVICITGNGLKTKECVSDVVKRTITIKPSISAFEKLVLSQIRRT